MYPCTFCLGGADCNPHLCFCCLQSQVFREYAAAYGWYGLLFIICMWAMEQTCRVLTNWWLSRWSTAESVAAYLHSLGELHCSTLQWLLLMALRLLKML